MAAIVTSDTLGISNAALANIGIQGGDPSTGRSGEAVYVNAATGNLVVPRQDELLAARGPDVGVLRTYNSRGLEPLRASVWPICTSALFRDDRWPGKTALHPASDRSGFGPRACGFAA